MQMIERVASAFYAALLPDAVAWEALGLAERSPYAEAARRAIVTLRAPSDAMLADGNRRDLPGDAANVWERMIYRALHE